MQNMSLEGFAKVTAYGSPALLILLGFYAYVGGLPVEWISGNNGLHVFGIVMIVFGVTFYSLELLLKIKDSF